jgi:hypothetical protein
MSGFDGSRTTFVTPRSGNGRPLAGICAALLFR